MINNLTEEAILEYLMTSEFNEGLTPEELKFLLFKFRNYYRVLNSKNDFHKGQIDLKSREISQLETDKDRNINELQISNVKIQEEHSILLKRKLSWKERILGKIINEDENK